MKNVLLLDIDGTLCPWVDVKEIEYWSDPDHYPTEVFDHCCETLSKLEAIMQFCGENLLIRIVTGRNHQDHEAATRKLLEYYRIEPFAIDWYHTDQNEAFNLLEYRQWKIDYLRNLVNTYSDGYITIIEDDKFILRSLSLLLDTYSNVTLIEVEGFQTTDGFLWRNYPKFHEPSWGRVPFD